MFARNPRRSRRSGRAVRRPDIAALVESLEGRQLLAYTPLGFGLPELVANGFAPPVASWGHQIVLTVNVQNLGSGSQIEPLNTIVDQNGVPLSAGAATSPASTINVFALRSATNFSGSLLIGSLNVPSMLQNSAIQISSSIILPPQPAGFPGDGGKIYLAFQANGSGTVFQTSPNNYVSPPVAVQIEAPLPELAAVGLDVPPVMQPGDTIQPTLRIANFGPGNTGDQGPLQVALVASTTPNFNSGSSIVALYNVANVPSQSLAPSKAPVFGDANLDPQVNVITIAGAPVTLPATPGKYYLGVVVDPHNQIKQLQKVPQFVKPKNPFSLSHVVGPPIANLPPAGVKVAGGVANVPVFPFPFGNNPGVPTHPIGGLPNGTFPAPFPAPSLYNIFLSTVSGTTTVASVSATATTTGHVVTTPVHKPFSGRRAVHAKLHHGA